MLNMLLAAAAAAGVAQAIPMDAARWDVQGGVAFVERDGKPTLRLGNDGGQPFAGGVANVKDLKLDSGIIEFDMMMTAPRDFGGPTFRQVKDGFGEMIYFRPHLVGKPDSIQYTPIINNNMAWQIFTGPGFEAEANYPLNKWIHVRTDVYQTSALVSVDGKPILHIPHLKGLPGAGDVGVAALIGGDYFANFVVTPIPGYQDPQAIEAEAPLPPGSVKEWQVSKALTEADAYRRASTSDWKGIEWTPLAVETNGIANLSKADGDDKEHYSFIARFSADSATARRVLMPFGFSDSVRIYLNGVPLYEGADLQNSRDYRFLGHVGFWDSLYLPLRKGKNEIVFVVSDNTNGGTAAAARIDPKAGVTIR